MPPLRGLSRRRGRDHLLPLHPRNGSRTVTPLVRLSSSPFLLASQLIKHAILRSNKPAPEIAKDYWRLRPDATMLDVIYAVRSDETSHRFVNHSLANLGKDDVNPFALREPDMHVKGKVIEFDRDVAAKYVQDSHDMLDKQKKAVDH